MLLDLVGVQLQVRKHSNLNPTDYDYRHHLGKTAALNCPFPVGPRTALTRSRPCPAALLLTVVRQPTFLAFPIIVVIQP